MGQSIDFLKSMVRVSVNVACPGLCTKKSAVAIASSLTVTVRESENLELINYHRSYNGLIFKSPGT